MLETVRLRVLCTMTLTGNKQHKVNSGLQKDYTHKTRIVTQAAKKYIQLGCKSHTPVTSNKTLAFSTIVQDQVTRKVFITLNAIFLQHSVHG